MSTRQNPGAFDCLSKLRDDEPYFVLRAKDPDAPMVVEDWVRRRSHRPGNENNPKLEEALQTAAKMREWRAKNVVDTSTGPMLRAPMPSAQGDGDPGIVMHGMGAVEHPFEHGDPGDEMPDTNRPGRRW